MRIQTERRAGEMEWKVTVECEPLELHLKDMVAAADALSGGKEVTLAELLRGEAPTEWHHETPPEVNRLVVLKTRPNGKLDGGWIYAGIWDGHNWLAHHRVIQPHEVLCWCDCIPRPIPVT